MSSRSVKDIMLKLEDLDETPDLESTNAVPLEWTDDIAADFFETKKIDIARVVDKAGEVVGLLALQFLPMASGLNSFGECQNQNCSMHGEPQHIALNSRICKTVGGTNYHKCPACRARCSLKEV